MGTEKGFLQELREVINKHSMENDSDTPDHILATFLGRCLNAFSDAVQTRERFREEAERKGRGENHSQQDRVAR